MTPLERIAAGRLLPLVTLEDPRDALVVARALVQGGLPVVEVTLRSSAAIEGIRRMASRGDVVVGAGTVLTGADVDSVVRAGAQFVVSPGTSRAVVERCREHAVAVIPGAVTATELMAASDLGVDLVKFFPAAASGGGAAVAALSAPFRELRFVPTGGITQSTMGDYLSLSAVLAVGGSWMLPADRISAGDIQGLTMLVAAAVAQASAHAADVPTRTEG